MSSHVPPGLFSGSGRAAASRLGRVLGLALAALVSAAGLSGCAAQRFLTITSNPPGATVRLDDELVGETPVRVEFLHYGTHRVTFYKRGYLSHAELHKTQPPWYGYFPLDIVSEVLIPVGWRDEERVHVELTAGNRPIEAPTLRSVMDRAEALRRAGPNGPRSLPPSTTAGGLEMVDPEVPPPPPGVSPDSPIGPPPIAVP